MTLFFGTLFFLILTDLFTLNIYFIASLYFVYVSLFLFGYRNKIVILPNKFFFKAFLLNTKVLFSSLLTVLFSWFTIPYTRTLKWKPLFKRTSYFGLYRSTRNQWLNK